MSSFARLLRTRSPLLLAALLAAGMLLATSLATAEESEQPTTKTWSGTWTNRKYKSTGPLRCVATRKDDTTAEATFSGKYVNDPFSYNVTVTTKIEGDRTSLTGTATLDGDRYQWSGYVRGQVLYGQFKSLKGHNGEFRLQESAK